MIIDVHAHISPTKKPVPKDFADATREFMLTTGIQVTHFATDDDLAVGLKEAGVDKACVLPIANANIDKAARLNDHVKMAMLGYPSIEGFASLNPTSRDAEEEADRVLREKGLRGLVVDPSQRFEFAGSEFWHILEVVKTNNASVIVHSEYMNDKFFDADDINETLMGFPQVNFVFSLAKSVGYILPEPNAYFETAHATREHLERAMETYGLDKLLYGSDAKYNFYPKGELEKINGLGLVPEDKAKILGRNAAKALKLSSVKKVDLFAKIGFLTRLAERFKQHDGL